MYNIGEFVVYGTSGVCTVEDITVLNMRDVPKGKKYYVLSPLNIKANKIFTPLEQTKVPLRKVITKEEAEELLRHIADVEEFEITNPKTSDEIYKTAMKSCDVEEYIRIIKTLFKKNRSRIEQGKKVTAAGERYLKMAEDALYPELAIALSLDRSKVSELVKKQL